MKKTKQAAGFTLIEAMIVVVILGVIASIALPSYRSHIVRAKRTEARSMLNEDAQFMERFMSTNNRYDQDVAAAAPVLPNLVVPSGATGANIRYVISFVPATLTQTSYSIQAIPKNSMASDPCGTYTLDNFGARTISGSSSLREECLNK